MIAGLALCMPMSLAAHHSRTADYDGGNPVTVKGVVTKVEWTNPHTHFYVEAKDEKGAVTLWNFERRARCRWSAAAGPERRFPLERK